MHPFQWWKARYICILLSHCSVQGLVSSIPLPPPLLLKGEGGVRLGKEALRRKKMYFLILCLDESVLKNKLMASSARLLLHAACLKMLQCSWAKASEKIKSLDAAGFFKEPFKRFAAFASASSCSSLPMSPELQALSVGSVTLLALSMGSVTLQALSVGSVAMGK